MWHSIHLIARFPRYLVNLLCECHRVNVIKYQRKHCRAATQSRHEFNLAPAHTSGHYTRSSQKWAFSVPKMGPYTASDCEAKAISLKSADSPLRRRG